MLVLKCSLLNILALICFDMATERQCLFFNGFSVVTTFQTKSGHLIGELGLYNNRPTAIGGSYAKGAVETLMEDGWSFLERHPRLTRKTQMSLKKILERLDIFVLLDCLLVVF